MSNAQSAPHTAGSDFKARRLALGLTRKQLAAASNTGVQTIARFELYGSTPHHTTLRRWSIALGIPIVQLLDLDDGEATGHAN